MHAPGPQRGRRPRTGRSRCTSSLSMITPMALAPQHDYLVVNQGVYYLGAGLFFGRPSNIRRSPAVAGREHLDHLGEAAGQAHLARAPGPARPRPAPARSYFLARIFPFRDGGRGSPTSRTTVMSAGRGRATTSKPSSIWRSTTKCLPSSISRKPFTKATWGRPRRLGDARPHLGGVAVHRLLAADHQVHVSQALDGLGQGGGGGPGVGSGEGPVA